MMGSFIGPIRSTLVALPPCPKEIHVHNVKDTSTHVFVTQAPHTMCRCMRAYVWRVIMHEHTHTHAHTRWEWEL